jgi:hypothetical protein
MRDYVEELERQLMVAAQTGMGRTHVSRRPGLIRSAAVTLAVSVAVAAGVLVETSTGGLGLSNASAAAVLRTAADAALIRSDPFPAARQFFYARWKLSILTPIEEPSPRQKSSEGYEARVSVLVRAWWSPTRPGVIRRRVLGVTFPTAAARERWEALGRPALGEAAPSTSLPASGDDVQVGNRLLTPRELLSLPRQPARLYLRLFAKTSAIEVLELVSRLDVYPIGGGLRAALYRALARVQGVRLAGSVRTLSGRAGEAVSARIPHSFGEQYELIVDVADGALLGSRAVATESRNGIPAGTVLSESDLVGRGISS